MARISGKNVVRIFGTRKGRTAVTINHDLKLLRKMFAWGIRERLLLTTPFKIGSENVVGLDPESPREERLTPAEAERKLFAAANPHLRGVLIAMLETTAWKNARDAAELTAFSCATRGMNRRPAAMRPER